MSFGWWEWSDEPAYTDSVNCPITVKGKVIFDSAGGKVTNKTRYRNAGQNVGTLPKATWSNHKFKGWYTKKSGGKKVTYKTKAPNKAKVTLYAHWKKR